MSKRKNKLCHKCKIIKSRNNFDSKKAKHCIECSKSDNLNDFQKRLEAFRQKNDGSGIESFFGTKPKVKKVKCETCLLKFSKGEMSIHDQNKCEKCYRFYSNSKRVFWKSKTPEERRKIICNSKKESGFYSHENSVLKFYEEKLDNLDSDEIESSKVQMKLAKFLKENGHKVEIERKISFPTLERSVDMLVNENLVIEFDGTYFHMDKRFYKPEDLNKKMGLTAQQIWDKDKRRNADIRSLGYELLIVKEYDYKNDNENVIKQVLEIADKAKDKKRRLLEDFKKRVEEKK